MKKVLSLFLSVVMLLSVSVSTGALAFAQAEPISLDSAVGVEVDTENPYKEYSFTPELDGTYVLVARGDYDTMGELYLGEDKIADDDDGGDNQNFRISYELKAGTEYTYRVKLYNSEASGSFEIVLTKLNDSDIITDVKVSGKDDTTFDRIEYTDGETRIDENEQEYFNYNLVLDNPDVTFVLTFKDNHTETFTYVNNDYYSDLTGERLFEGGFSYNNSQNIEHWTLGNTYYFDLEISYHNSVSRVNYPVKIVENPIKSISYTVKNVAELYENTGGSYDYDDNDNEFYYYNVPTFATGDVLSVTDANNQTTDYTYRFEEDIDRYCFITADGSKIIESSDVTISSDQYKNHWTLGENEYTVEYFGRTAKIKVNIVALPDYEIQDISVGEEKDAVMAAGNTFADFTFIPAEDGDYCFFSTGDKDTYGYILEENEDEIASNDDGDNSSNFSVTATLEKGKKYILRARFFDKENKGVFKVGLKKTKVNFGALTLNKSTEIISDGRGNKVATFTPSKTAYYTFDITDAPKYYDVTIMDGENYLVAAYDSDDLLEAKLEAGKTYNFKFYFEEAASYKITPKEVDTSNIKGISLKNNTATVIEYQTGYFASQSDLFYYDTYTLAKNQEITVEYTNGSKKSVLIGNSNFRIDGHYVDWQDNQSEHHQWLKGGDSNIITFNYLGFTADMKVNIIENPVERIEAVPAYDLIENFGGYMADETIYDEEKDAEIDVSYYKYNIHSMPLNITVYNKDGSSYSFKGNANRGYNGYGIYVDSNQSYDNQWNSKNDNCELTVTYLDSKTTCKVKVLPNTISDVNFTQKVIPSEKTNEDGFIGDIADYLNVEVVFEDGSKDLLNNETFMVVDGFGDSTTAYLTYSAEGKHLYTFDIQYTSVYKDKEYVTPAGSAVKLTFGDIKKSFNIEFHTHSYTAAVTAPTCTEKGYTTYTCACGDSYIDNYTDALGHKWNAGVVTKKPTPSATGVKTYTCTVCSARRTETVAKIPKYNNTLTLKAKKPSLKAKDLKKKKRTIALNKAITVTKAQGKVTYKKASGNKNFTVASNGKITVKKGTKKGNYKIKIKVTAAGNANYKPISKNVTVTIKVK